MVLLIFDHDEFLHHSSCVMLMADGPADNLDAHSDH